MFRFKHAPFCLICIFCISIGLSSYAEEDDNPMSGKKLESGNVSNSLFSLSADPSNSGINNESVNLFTGQHQESFSLVSLAGRGGLGLSLTLDYDGNVTHIAKQENRKVQSSPFGLGFSIGVQSIVCDHKSTASISDDSYSLMVNGSPVELKHVSDNSFITATGDPWLITRHIKYIDGFNMVIAWTIKREDGTVYNYGDSAFVLPAGPANYNATKYMFHYGNYVGNGVTDDAKLYPHTWYLKKIRDPENLNVITFNYLQETAALQVMDSKGNVIPSTKRYTRAVYLNEVTMPDGHRIIINHGGREDYQPYNDVNNYDYYHTKKAEEIKVLNPDSEVLSVTKLSYSYIINSYGNNAFKKLILTKIDNYSGDETEALPPLRFEYYSDPDDIKFGAIKKIHYSSGSIKAIDYTELADSKNISSLSTIIDPDGGGISDQYVS